MADVEVADFDRVYAVNVRGSFNVTKYAVPHMLKNDYGRVLLIASIAGKEGNAVGIWHRPVAHTRRACQPTPPARPL